MKKRTLTDAVGSVADTYVLEAMPEDRTERKRRTPWRYAVACAVLLCLLTTTAFAAPAVVEEIRGWFFQVQYRPDDFSYRISYDADRVPVAQLSEEVRALKDVILQQCEEYTPVMSTVPTSVYRYFDDVKEAERFVGCDRLLFLAPDGVEEETTVTVHGDYDGNIRYVSVWTRYGADDLRITAITQLYTEYYDGETSFGGADAQGRLYEESSYLTAQGLECHIVESRPTAEGYDFCSLDGYLVVDGISYSLHVSYPGGDTDKALALTLLQDWADQFPAQ